VPPADPGAFADALMHAADHREALPLMGQRALALARSRFDRGVLAKAFVDWLEGSSGEVKRAFDLLLVLLTALIWAPVLIVLALFVRLRLGHPIFFTQFRPGLHGELFKLVKFRHHDRRA